MVGEKNQFDVSAEALAYRLRELEERVRALEERERETIEREQKAEEERRKQEELREFLDAYPPTHNAHRVHQRKVLEEEYNLTYQGSRSRHGALMIFRRPRGDEVRVIVYVVNTKNRAGQCVFSINHLEDGTADWALLVAWPFRRFYLKKISEIRERKGKATKSKQANVTIREGSPPDDLFKNRIRELVAGD